MQRKTLTVVVIAGLLVSGLGALFTFNIWMGKGNNGSADIGQTRAALERETSGPHSTVAVTTTSAVKGPIQDYLRLNGDVITKTSVDVFAETAGVLVGIKVGMGDFVFKNQVLVEVDPSRPGMEFAINPVKSPIAGTITALPAQLGATITPAVALVRIGRLNELRVRTAIPERFIAKVTLGMRAEIEFAAYPGLRFSARVSEISPVLDPLSRTMEIRLVFDTLDQRIKAGMFGEIKLITVQKQAVIALPVDCLVERSGKSAVFVVTEGSRVALRNVRVGINQDGMVEITSGLNVGDEVVWRGQSLLEAGTAVRIISRVDPGSLSTNTAVSGREGGSDGNQ